MLDRVAYLLRPTGSRFDTGEVPIKINWSTRRSQDLPGLNNSSDIQSLQNGIR